MSTSQAQARVQEVRSKIQSRVQQAKSQAQGKMGGGLLKGGLLKDGGFGFGLLEGLGSGGMLGQSGQVGQRVQQARAQIQGRMAKIRAGGLLGEGLLKQNINVDANSGAKSSNTSSNISIAE